MFRKKIPQKSYFISIGAGQNQIPLIKEAKKCGYHVIGVDINLMAPGFTYCDLKIQESIENENEIYEIIRECIIDGEILCVLTKSFGKAVKTACFLSEKFGISLIPYRNADLFISKPLMKTRFIDCGLLTPDTIEMPKKSIYRFNSALFPIVIKPCVGHAKTDVLLLHDLYQLKKTLENQKKKANGFLLEKYIEGDEIIAAGIVHQKKFFLIDITDKIKTASPHFVDLAHISPSKYTHLSGKILKIGQKVADAFEIHSSPLIMEFIVDCSQNLYLIEAVPEFGGEYITDILIPARTGYRTVAAVIKSITGSGFTPPPEKMKKNCVIIQYIAAEKEGAIQSFNSIPAHAKKKILHAAFFKKIGDRVKKPATNHDRLGVVIACGKTRENASARANEAIQRMAITIG